MGPTATGKTAMGVALAKRYGGEVVSVDSMQIYRGMSVGTAAPSPEETEGIPHHMIAVADPGEQWSVSRYAAAADECVQDILRRGRLPILVGGTGLYFAALLRGTSFAAGQSGSAVRQALEQRMAQEGGEALLTLLRQVDPETAARLHPNDEKRIIRALEVWQETGETISEHDRRTREAPPRYRAVSLALTFSDRSDLYRRIDDRVDRMVEKGLLQEVRELLALGLPPTATAWQAIGYKQLLPVARGKGTVEEAVAEIKLRSRQYAKRQLTWLRRDPTLHWIFWEKEPNFPAGLQKATEILTAEGVC